jgi:hypothetical protein
MEDLVEVFIQRFKGLRDCGRTWEMSHHKVHVIHL